MGGAKMTFTKRMTQMKLKHYILSVLFLLLFNGVVYIMSEFNLANSQKDIKETNMHILSTHY